MKCERCALRASLDVARAMGDTRIPLADGRFRISRDRVLWLCSDHAKGLGGVPA